MLLEVCHNASGFMHALTLRRRDVISGVCDSLTVVLESLHNIMRQERLVHPLLHDARTPCRFLSIPNWGRRFERHATCPSNNVNQFNFRRLVNAMTRGSGLRSRVSAFASFGGEERRTARACRSSANTSNGARQCHSTNTWLSPLRSMMTSMGQCKSFDE